MISTIMVSIMTT